MSPSQCRITGEDACDSSVPVDGAVVVGTGRRRGQRARRHQDHRRALALDERELLLVGARARRPATPAPGSWSVPGAARELPADGLRLGHRAADQLLRRRPVQAHPALRGVHRLGDAQPVRPQVPAEGERRLPVQLRRTGRVAARQRVGDDVRGRVSTRASAARRRAPAAARAAPACRSRATPSARGSVSVTPFTASAPARRPSAARFHDCSASS